MYQLILHHIYRNGPFAIDISGAESHGLVTAASYSHAGAKPDSGALVFKSPHSRVRVPLGPTGLFQRLFALKIEVTVRIDALGQRRNLVEGDDSFAFFVDPDGHLWGAYNGPQYAGGPKIWQGANSRDDAPDGGEPQKVPVNRWVTLRYEHDGFASIRLFVDGALVAANYKLRSGVPPVVNTGVSIGNWTLSDAYTFDGAIDEVKIWRWDPDDGMGHFLARPLDKCTAPCWKEQLDWLAARLRDPNDGPRLASAMRCLGAAQNEMVRLVRSKGEDAIRINAKLSAEYRKLWMQQPLDSQAMRHWQKRWFEWLVATVGEAAWKDYVERVQRCLIASEVLNRLPKLGCDQGFVGYLLGFGEATGNPIDARPGKGGGKGGGHGGSHGSTAY